MNTASQRRPRVRPRVVPLLVPLLLAATAPTSHAAPATAPATPATAPVTRPSRDAKVARLLDYLTGEYAKQARSREWIQRSLAVIGLAQFPTDAATDVILERLANETHAVGRLVAWQAVLGRASRLTDAQFAVWQRATARMMKDDLFHGDLRVGLLEMLAAAPLTLEHRKLMQEIFIKSNALDSTDVPTLVATGRAIRAWGDAGAVEDLLAATTLQNAGVRARFVLKAAGFEPAVGEPPEKFREWWKANRDAFTKAKPPPQAWRKLRPQYVAAPIDAAKVDPDDPQWSKQLELTGVGLKDFDFGVVIDCSRSMGGELARLKRDLQVMYAAFAQVAMEPRVGITGFAPGGEVQNFPLNGRKAELLAAVQKLDIFGPAGEEEWAGGVEACMNGSKWSAGAAQGPGGGKGPGRRVIAIISDEPITPAQHDKLVPLMKRADAEGFRVYAVMILPLTSPPDPLAATTGRAAGADDDDADDDLPPRFRRGKDGTRPRGPNAGGGGKLQGWQSYAELTAMAGGEALACRVPQGGFGLGTLTSFSPGGAGGGPRKNAPPIDPATAIAPVYPGGGPTARLLTAVLVDAINPQYADRVEPLVKVLVNHSQHAAPHLEERRPAR